jgi:hypothetical protein
LDGAGVGLRIDVLRRFFRRFQSREGEFGGVSREGAQGSAEEGKRRSGVKRVSRKVAKTQRAAFCWVSGFQGSRFRGGSGVSFPRRREGGCSRDIAALLPSDGSHKTIAPAQRRSGSSVWPRQNERLRSVYGSYRVVNVH